MITFAAKKRLTAPNRDDQAAIVKSYGLITPCFARISLLGKSWHINRIIYLENLTSWSGFILAPWRASDAALFSQGS
ncbi:hypothetical protein ACLEE6_11980 [Lonsdalea quercina]|uniref:hypothetical protein n=1 Tax=Lonsdalea quercina TaxID=71657 RepID=UPI003976D7F4